MEQAIAGRRHVEEQLCIPPHGAEVEVHEIVGAAHLHVVRWMVEPAGPDRGIHLGGTPHGARGVTVLECGDHAVAAGTGEGNGRWIDGGPVGVAAGPVLVAAPPHVGARVGKDHRLGLVPLDEREESRPVIDLALAIRPLAVRPVEPHFRDAAILRQQLGELIAVEIVVARRVTVRWIVPVPWRQVEPGAKSLGATGIDHLAHYVARSTAPWALRHGVVRRAARPQAEAVVMLRREYE